MLRSAKNLTPPIRASAPFFASVLRPARRRSFSILRSEQTSSAACYGAIALALLAGIAINVVLIIRSVLSSVGTAP